MSRLLNPRKLRDLFAASFLLAACSSAYADTVLETETAELGVQGEVTFSNSVQFDHARDGRDYFTLTQFEYGITDRAEILIEPFFQEWDFPKNGHGIRGVGDLEITPSYVAFLETPETPAIVAALKVKVPTASNHDIGSGKYDYYPYLIFGKHVGTDWIINANLGYNFITSPPGDHLKNQGIYDLSVERVLSEKLSVYAEVFGNTSPAPGESGTFAGAVAAEYHFTDHFNVFVSTGYDTNHEFNIRPGFNLVYNLQ